MLHHVDDSAAVDILKQTRRLSAPGAAVCVYDPDAARPSDSLYTRWFYKLERGQFVRSHSETETLVRRAGLVIREKLLLPIRPGLPGLPPVARCVRFISAWETQSDDHGETKR